MGSEPWALAAQNPLRAGLLPMVSRSEWKRVLTVDPRSEWQGMVPRDYAAASWVVEQMSRLFLPSHQQVSIVMSMHRMLLNGLDRRDPRSGINKRKRYSFDCANIDSLLIRHPNSMSSASGMIAKGPTRVGKSRAVEVYLSLLPQARTLELDPSDGSELHELRQLTYLVIQMPTDSSRSGFLLDAFQKMDQALSTNYAEMFGRLPIDSQRVQFVAKLFQHCCGILVIEEAQSANLSRDKFSQDFLNLLLAILNSGTPVVMVGNTQAFKALSEKSQILARLTEGGCFDVTPMSNYEGPAWRNEIIRDLWSYSVYSEPDEHLEDLDYLVWRYTAGVRGYVTRLRKATLMASLESGAGCVKPEHIHKAFQSPTMRELHPLIEGLTTGNIGLLRNFTDMPLEELESKWAMRKLKESQQSECHPDIETTSKSEVKGEDRSRRIPKAKEIAQQSQSPEQVAKDRFFGAMDNDREPI